MVSATKDIATLIQKKKKFMNQLFTWNFSQELGFLIILSRIWDVQCVPNWIFIFQLWLIQQRSNRFIKESHHIPKTSFYKSLKSFQDLGKNIQMCHAYSYNMIWKKKSFIIKKLKVGNNFESKYMEMMG